MDELADFRNYKGPQAKRTSAEVKAELNKTNLQILINPNIAASRFSEAGLLEYGQKLIGVREMIRMRMPEFQQVKAGKRLALMTSLIGSPEIGDRQGRPHIMLIARFDGFTMLDFTKLKPAICQLIGSNCRIAVKAFKDEIAINTAYVNKATLDMNRGQFARATIRR